MATHLVIAEYAGGKLAKQWDDFIHYIIVVGQLSHGLRGTAHVHTYIRYFELSKGGKHIPIKLPT